WPLLHFFAAIDGSTQECVMLDRFSDRAQKVMAYANLEANRFGNDHLQSEHLLLGLIREGKGAGAEILRSLDIDLAELAHELERVTPKHPPTHMSKRPLALEAKSVLDAASKEAERLAD